jgi:ribosome-associated protein
MTGAQRLARAAAGVAHEKLGEDIVILDLRETPLLADFFVIVTAVSTPHSQALAEAVVEKLKPTVGRPHHVEGLDFGQWVVLDYFGVVVHIFLGDVRRFYGLERLWGDVPAERPFPIEENRTGGAG